MGEPGSVATAAAIRMVLSTPALLTFNLITDPSVQPQCAPVCTDPSMHDPSVQYERVNAIAEPGCHAEIRKLRGALLNWMEDTQDPLTASCRDEIS
jgi:hypothetical protein